MSDPRSQYRRQQFRVAVLSRWGPWCHRCQGAIDLRLKFPHKQSFTADHVPELALLLERGLNPFDPNYGRPAHLSCNASAGAAFGNRRRAPQPRRGSLAWD